MADTGRTSKGNIEVTIGVGTREFDRNLKKSEQQLEKFAKRMENIAGKLESLGKKLMLGVTAPIVGIGVASIKTAAEMQAFSNNFNQSFQEMSDSARAWSHEFGDAVGRSRLQMETMMSVTQAMVYPMLENREAAAQMSQAITQLAIDLGSFYDVADTEALDALRSGLIGNSEPMRRFGVVVLDATLELEAQRIGLQRNVAQMSEAEKMLLRYVQILRQTADAHGDAIRNGHEFGNQLKALQADFENLRMELGEELLPYATALLRWARDLMSALSDLDDETVHTLINFGVWAASSGVLVWTLGKVIRGIAGVSKALNFLFTLMNKNPWLVLGAVAGGMLLTIDEVQESLESLARNAGLGGLLDAFEDVTGALGELLDIASDLEFSTAPDVTAYIDAMTEARLAAEESLLSGLVSGGEDARKALAQLFDEIHSDLMSAFKVDVTLDHLMDSDLSGWSIGKFEIRDFLSSDRSFAEVEREVAMREQAVRRGLAALIEAGIDPHSDDPQAAIFRRYVEDLQEARRELNALQREMDNKAFTDRLRQIYFDNVILPNTMDGLSKIDATFYERQAEALRQEIEEKLRSVDMDDIFMGEGVFVSPQKRAELVNRAGVSGLLKQMEEYERKAAQMRLEDRLQGIGDALAEMFPGGAKYEVEQFLAGLSGETFDGLDYQLQAVSRALWDQINALQEAGKSWGEIQDAIAPNVALFSQLSEQQWSKMRQGRIDAIGANLDQALGSERWIQLEFARAAGEEFDALQFEADALRAAMDDLAAQMLADGATVGDVLEATTWHMARLAEVTDQMRRRQETSWLEDQYAQSGQMLREFGMDLMFAATPAGILGAVLDNLAGPVDRLLAPISIMAEVISVMLEPAFKALFPILKGFGILIVSIVTGISTVWNAIVGTIGGVFKALASLSILGVKPFGFLQGTADFFMSLQIDTGELGDALQRLRDLTWDQAEATKQATEAMRNVPSGFKIALTRFQVAEPVPLATGGIVTSPTYAMVGEAGPEAVVPLDQAGALGGTQIIIKGDVYGWDDFRRKVAQADSENKRSSSLTRYGR